MTYKFLLILLATVARALMAHTCGEGLRLAFEYGAPNTPPPLCLALGLLAGVMLLAVTIWRRRDDPRDPP
jgi:hypothetical protein